MHRFAGDRVRGRARPAPSSSRPARVITVGAAGAMPYASGAGVTTPTAWWIPSVVADAELRVDGRAAGPPAARADVDMMLAHEPELAVPRRLRGRAQARPSAGPARCERPRLDRVGLRADRADPRSPSRVGGVLAEPVSTAACVRAIASSSSTPTGGASERVRTCAATSSRSRLGLEPSETPRRAPSPSPPSPTAWMRCADRGGAVADLGAGDRDGVRPARRVPARARVDGGRDLAAGLAGPAWPAGLRPAEPGVRPVLVHPAVSRAGRRVGLRVPARLRARAGGLDHRRDRDLRGAVAADAVRGQAQRARGDGRRAVLVGLRVHVSLAGPRPRRRDVPGPGDLGSGAAARVRGQPQAGRRSAAGRVFAGGAGRGPGRARVLDQADRGGVRDRLGVRGRCWSRRAKSGPTPARSR